MEKKQHKEKNVIHPKNTIKKNYSISLLQSGNNKINNNKITSFSNNKRNITNNKSPEIIKIFNQMKNIQNKTNYLFNSYLSRQIKVNRRRDMYRQNSLSKNLSEEILSIKNSNSFYNKKNIFPKDIKNIKYNKFNRTSYNFRKSNQINNLKYNISFKNKIKCNNISKTNDKKKNYNFNISQNKQKYNNKYINKKKEIKKSESSKVIIEKTINNKKKNDKKTIRIEEVENKKIEDEEDIKLTKEREETINFIERNSQLFESILNQLKKNMEKEEDRKIENRKKLMKRYKKKLEYIYRKKEEEIENNFNQNNFIHYSYINTDNIYYRSGINNRELINEEQDINIHPIEDDIFYKLSLNKIGKVKNFYEKNMNCSICLQDFVYDDIVIYLPCTHFFHKTCLIKWIKNNAICPLCKLDINSI